ncbi:MAG TPA: hypothetical protein VH136_02095 [Trebonia sp.]|jgi:hypothetical protein|nr:hypothetical protein [Trebonia sp.]
MTASAAVVWAIVAVAVAGLAVWLIAVSRTERYPYFRNPHDDRRRGRVQGGTHVGGGRSVAPRRDAPVIPDENPDDSMLPDRAGRPGSGSGNPLDL